jgi:hypothetical protein
MYGFEHWFQKIWALARMLGHYWAIYAGDHCPWPSERPENVGEFTRAWDEAVEGMGEPGIDLSHCMWEEGPYDLLYCHETASGRLRIDGKYASERHWHITVTVQRPYPWQPWAAWIRYERNGDDPKLHVSYTWPAGERHAYWVREVVEALGFQYDPSWEVDAEGKSLVVSDEELPIADAYRAIRALNLPVEAVEQALERVRKDDEAYREEVETCQT